MWIVEALKNGIGTAPYPSFSIRRWPWVRQAGMLEFPLFDAPK
jgi:hypothetical protein